MVLVRKIQRFAALTWRQRFVFLEASATLLRVRLMLRFAAERILADALRLRDGRADGAAAGDIARLVALATSQQISSAACLPRALTAQRLLRRRNIDAQLRIGGRIEHAVLHGHAWIETGGRPVGDEAWPSLMISPEAAALWFRSRSPYRCTHPCCA
jgi:hypothetical protein